MKIPMMGAVSKSQVQIVVVALVVLVWLVALVLAVFVDDTMLKAVTPVMTLTFGWLFAQRLTNGG